MMKKAIIREPVVSGRFYPDSALELKRQIESFMPASVQKTDVLGCILPHAGYIYSGRVAVETVSGINIKDTVILFGPSHTGMGAEFSIMTDGAWRTPLGDVLIDRDLAQALLKDSKYLKDDAVAHLSEHSLEVEIPILQYFRPGFKIVPVSLRSNDSSVLKEIGFGIGSLLRKMDLAGSVLLIASSDMTHYEPHEQARHKDSEAIKAILGLDEDGLVRKVESLQISMCGEAPVVALLCAVKAMGAKSAKLMKYQTSGEISGDYDSVVGYAGITIQ